MDRVAVVPHLGKETAVEVGRKCAALLNIAGVSVIASNESTQVMRVDTVIPVDESELVTADAAVVIGGDGAMLSAARFLAPSGVPLLGINTGHLGFMTQVEVHDVEIAMSKLVRQEFTISNRCMLRATVNRKTHEIFNVTALNDIVITKGALARIVSLTTYINAEHVATYRADGIIVATPTGSTAYSLSAGGPIVDPNVDAIIVTPICAHTVGSRPIVASGEGVIRLEISSYHNELMLTADGQVGYRLESGDTIEVIAAPYKAKLINIMGLGFFTLVQKRVSEGRL